MKVTTLFMLLAILWPSLSIADDFWVKTSLPDTITVSSLTINSSGHIFAGCNRSFEFGGGEGFVYRSTDNGDTWTQTVLVLIDYNVFSLAINSSGHIFAGTGDPWSLSNKGELYRSTDNGDTWTITGLKSVYVNALAINDSGHIFAGTGEPWLRKGGVYRSTNNGNTWTLVGLEGVQVNSFAINDSGYIFAGITPHGIYCSTDNGDTWRTLLDVNVTSIAINDSGHIFAGSYSDSEYGPSRGFVYRSTDNGDTWTQTVPTYHYVLSLAINDSGHIFAGTGGGVYRSTDNGDTWTKFGLDSDAVNSFVINSNGYIFAMTGYTVYRSSLPTIDAVKEIKNELPLSYKLLQNYPNPFNPTTMINYQLAMTSDVNLSIYNILGQKVATLVNKKQPAGNYSVEWNASGFASGIYIYQLTAKGQQQKAMFTKKLVLLK